MEMELQRGEEGLGPVVEVKLELTLADVDNDGVIGPVHDLSRIVFVAVTIQLHVFSRFGTTLGQIDGTLLYTELAQRVVVAPILAILLVIENA